MLKNNKNIGSNACSSKDYKIKRKTVMIALIITTLLHVGWSQGKREVVEGQMWRVEGNKKTLM
ncbi:MAG TPA: hypothetical protein HA348_00035 [Thermoplasmata archaeon]|nr:hypothetical protein [Thermoplasmata archaeon]